MIIRHPAVGHRVDEKDGVCHRRIGTESRQRAVVNALDEFLVGVAEDFPERPTFLERHFDVAGEDALFAALVRVERRHGRTRRRRD